MWKPALINEGLRLGIGQYSSNDSNSSWKPALINEGLRHLNPINLPKECGDKVETCPH